MGRALNFLRFQIKMVGMVEMVGEMERLTQWGEAALSSSEGEQAAERELGKSRNHDYIFLRIVMTKIVFLSGW